MGDKNFKNYYANYGKTPFKIITQFLFLKRYYRKLFIDKNFIKIMNDTKSVYFPLHVEPERSLILIAPFYLNQIELITNIAKSIPVGYKLYVKEHVGMSTYGWRDIQFYKQILDLPNVRLVHPSVSSDEILKECSLVVTIAGTAGFEALFYNKPVIVFADVSYMSIPPVTKIENIEDLPNTIRSILNEKVDVSKLNEYVNRVERTTFEFNLIDLYTGFNNYFFDEFSGIKKEISETKMIQFFEQYKSSLEKLAHEHIKQINWYKKKDGKSI
jgi:capsule polysaccharide modification protein KpsS